MKNLKFLLSFFIFISLVSSCSEEEIDPNLNPGTNPVGTVFPTTDVNVILPAGTSIDLSKTKLLSGFAEFPVDNAGKSKIRFASGTTKLAFLVDETGNSLMMGFITDAKKEISIETTASVLVYFGLGVSLQPIEIQKKYLEGYSAMEGMAEFTQTIKEEFSKNPEMIRNGGFINSFTDYLSTFAPADTIDIRAKQIQVDPNGFKSGIQVYELDHQNVQIRNQYRRRAHAFAYKTAFKDKDGVETIIKSRIGGTDAAEKDIAVSPTGAITSFTGTLRDWMLGKGPEFAMTENGPVNLPIKESESEATYKVRIVGPGAGNLGGLSLTSAERDKLNRLVLETFAMDFFLPLIFDVIGMKDVLSIPKSNFTNLITAIDLFVKGSPLIEKLLEDGNYGKALQESMLLGTNELANAKFDDVVKAVALGGLEIIKANKPGSVTETAEDIGKKAKSLLNAMKYADILIKIVDYNRLMNHIVMSDYNAEFTAKVKADDLVMSPKEETIITSKYYTVKVETKTVLAEGESFVYKWSTPGKFIYLWHQNKKLTEAETSTATMTYRSDTKASDLSDDSNLDLIKVEVFTKKGTTLTRIGDAEAKINVQKIKLVMKPDNITLRGGQSVRLYLERTDGINDIVQNSALDYKVEWETPGAYGKFNGTLRSATTMGNALNYEVLDKEVREAKENITARVYFKAKADSEWTLRETVKGTLKIDNDPNKIILDVALETRTWDNSGSKNCNVGVNMMAVVPVHPKAKKYTVTFYGFKKPSSWENRTRSWLPGQTPPVTYGFPGAGPNQIVGGNYYFTIGRTWGDGPMNSSCGSKIPDWIAFYNSFGGRANIVIEIEE
jgi:molybdopterin synthase catalytic subunit